LPAANLKFNSSDNKSNADISACLEFITPINTQEGTNIDDYRC
jgi:hypothetical protein